MQLSPGGSSSRMTKLRSRATGIRVRSWNSTSSPIDTGCGLAGAASGVFEVWTTCLGITCTGMIWIVASPGADTYWRAPPISPFAPCGALWFPDAPSRLS